VEEPTVVVGKVTKAHGLRGEVTVLPLTDNPDRFSPGNVVYLEDGRALTIGDARDNGARLLVTFEGVGDRTGAETLRGAMLVVPESALPELPEGTYWPHQLEGCEVLTMAGRSLGAITDVVANPANDIWVTTGVDGQEILVPAIHQVIAEVDVAGRRVLVHDVPGITTPEAE
jgi:16S rRNA processing protein RimM